MNHYHHLTSFERTRIEMFYLKDKYSMRHIAKLLHRSVSTISRELNRLNTRKYSSESAHWNARLKRKVPRRQSILSDETTRKFVVKAIAEYHWSPEQISGYLKIKYKINVSYNTIYRAIRKNNLGEPKVRDKYRGIEKKLRHKGKNRHNVCSIERRGKLSIAHTIAERPIEANLRSRIGDWELDTIRGKQGGQVLVTLVDRCSRKLFIQRAESGRNIDVNIALEQILNSVNPNDIHTITPDRGKEFSLHAVITDKYSVEFYFANPHSPWQRGTNENSNGLIREFIPKGHDIASYDDDYLQKCAFRINNRPRKLFNWKSAQDIYNANCST